MQVVRAIIAKSDMLMVLAVLVVVVVIVVVLVSVGVVMLEVIATTGDICSNW